MKNIFCSLFCFFCILSIHAQKLLLEGTIGKHAIIMELEISEYDPNIYGKYFYESSLQDIQVGAGKKSGYNISLTVKKSFSDELMETFTLIKKADTFTGTWKDAISGNSLSVYLKAVDVDKLSSKYDRLHYIQQLKTKEPYSYMRLNHVQAVTIDSVSVIGKYSMQWVAIPNTNMLHFKVSNGYDSITLNRLNDALKEQWLNNAEGYFSCHLNGEKEVDYHTQIRPTFLNEHYVSYSEQSDWYCGGAHPEVANYGTTIDVHTGKRIELDDILWLADWPRDTSLAEDERRLLFSNYRDEVLAPSIVTMLTELYPDNMKTPATNDDCDYSNAEYWSGWSFYLTQRGIFVGPFFHRVYRDCDMEDWSVIPYNRLRWLLSNEVEKKLPK